MSGVSSRVNHYTMRHTITVDATPSIFTFAKLAFGPWKSLIAVGERSADCGNPDQHMKIKIREMTYAVLGNPVHQNQEDICIVHRKDCNRHIVHK